MRRLALVILLAAGSARADQLHFSRPGPYETALHIAALTAIAMDMSTTLDASHRHFVVNGIYYQYSERNPLLGLAPGDAKIVGYGLGMMALHTAAWYFAPEELRVLLDAGTIAIEGSMVYSNMSVGLRLRVPFR